MDAPSRKYTGGHRLVFHDMETVNFLAKKFGKISEATGLQAKREAVMHLAMDRGLIRKRDIEIAKKFATAVPKKKIIKKKKSKTDREERKLPSV